MNRHWLAVALLSGALTISTPLLADHGKSKGRGISQSNHAVEHQERHGDRYDDRWERRDKYEYRIYGLNDGRPPGWSKGRKVGWRDCGLPPGQAKKHGCWSYVHEGRRYYYYRDEVGRIIVRRPILSVYGGIEIR